MSASTDQAAAAPPHNGPLPSAGGTLPTNRAWISESLLIASAPVAAYALTLSYMVGFAGFFRIPAAFLSVNIGTMFSTASELFFPILLVMCVFFGAYLLMPSSEHPVAEKIVIILPLTAIFVSKMAMFERRWQEWAPTLLSLVVVASFLFRPTARPYLSVGGTRLSRYIESTTFRKLQVFYIFAWMALTISHDAGRAAAMFQRQYLVPVLTSDTVVLTSFGDNLIVAAFDRKTKEVDRSFSILKKAEDPKQVLRWETIGPLQLKPEAPPAPPAAAPKPAAPPSPKP